MQTFTVTADLFNPGVKFPHFTISPDHQTCAPTEQADHLSGARCLNHESIANFTALVSPTQVAQMLSDSYMPESGCVFIPPLTFNIIVLASLLIVMTSWDVHRWRHTSWGSWQHSSPKRWNEKQLIESPVTHRREAEWLHFQSMAVLLQTQQRVTPNSMCVSHSPQSTLRIWPGLAPVGEHTQIYIYIRTHCAAIASDSHSPDVDLCQWNNRSAPSLNASPLKEAPK